MYTLFSNGNDPAGISLHSNVLKYLYLDTYIYKCVYHVCESTRLIIYLFLI